jgi:hypothetical protein
MNQATKAAAAAPRAARETRRHRATATPPSTNPAADTARSSSRDDAATRLCPVCERPYIASGRAVYCSDGCRKKAWRRRRTPRRAPVVVPAPGRPLRPVTVYACEACGTAALGVQRCDECGAFMTRVGIGGLCPHCEGPVAVCDLVEVDIVTVAAPSRSAATGRRRA